jgi:hypothetical protein
MEEAMNQKDGCIISVYEWYCKYTMSIMQYALSKKLLKENCKKVNTLFIIVSFVTVFNCIIPSHSHDGDAEHHECSVCYALHLTSECIAWDFIVISTNVVVITLHEYVQTDIPGLMRTLYLRGPPFIKLI